MTPATRRTRARTVFADLAREGRRVAAAKSVDFAAYRGRPVDFQRDVLGYEPAEPQVEVFEALEASDRVSVPSGRATGKSRLDAGEALYFAGTQGPNALVIFTAPTFKQVQNILWEELQTLYYGAKVKLGGRCARRASTGLRLADGSRILGIVGDTPEAFQGLRAPRMLVVADEGSGIEDSTFAVMEGNLAGGGKLLVTGNPTRDEGFFFNSFTHDKRFRVVSLPSTRSPNVVAGRVVVPGMATREWIEERKKQWGEDSPMYRVHVLGQAARMSADRLYSEAMVKDAVTRWETVTPSGRIVIGLDPAGETGMGDESSFAVRRGPKVLWIRRRRGLSEDGHIVEVNGMIRDIRKHPSNVADAGVRRRALVVVDRDGDVGAKVYAALVAEAQRQDALFEVLGVRGSERARSRAKDIDKVRDELAVSLVAKLRDLGIPNDTKTLEEMSKIRVVEVENGRAKIVSKKVLRKELGRSPDGFDSLALCTYFDDEAEGEGGDDFDAPHEDIDPWNGATIDPYGAVG